MKKATFSGHIENKPAFIIEGGTLANFLDLRFKKRYIAKFMFEYFGDAFAHVEIQGHTVSEGNMWGALDKYVTKLLDNVEHGNSY